MCNIRITKQYSHYYIVIDAALITCDQLCDLVGYNIKELKEFFDNINIEYSLEETCMFGTFLCFPLGINSDNILNIINSLIIAKELRK